jgi:hypothetical protein
VSDQWIPFSKFLSPPSKLHGQGCEFVVGCANLGVSCAEFCNLLSPLHRIGNASNIGAVKIFYQKTKSNLFTSFLYNKTSHKLNCNFMILIDTQCVWYILLILKKSAFDLIFSLYFQASENKQRAPIKYKSFYFI